MQIKRRNIFLFLTVLLLLFFVIGYKFMKFNISQIIVVNRHIKPALSLNEDHWVSKYSYSPDVQGQSGDHTLRLSKDEVAIKLKNGEVVRVKDAEIIIFNFRDGPVLIYNNAQATGF